MNTRDLQLLRDIYEHFDGIADGAPDASYAAKQALSFSEPLKKLIDVVQGRLSFPVGAIIETVSPVAHLGSAIPVGARGRITSHCDDGRAWILFDDYNDAGHTFHAPEHFIRVVELPGSEME